jgi:hypothetical protein
MGKRTKSHNSIGPLKDENGDLKKSDQDKAELLNNYFKSVFTHENPGGVLAQDIPQRTNKIIDTIYFDPTEIELCIKKLNKTENHFSHYPRSQVDINSYTRLKIAMSLIAGKA